jgi:hypothetical protein
MLTAQRATIAPVLHVHHFVATSTASSYRRKPKCSRIDSHERFDTMAVQGPTHMAETSFRGPHKLRAMYVDDDKEASRIYLHILTMQL